MHLSAEERNMLDGYYGKTVQKCMKVLVTLGEIYEAEYMVEVRNVHFPGVSYRVTGDAGLNYVKEASKDATFRVPATLNTIGIDSEKWESMGFPLEFAHKQLELIEAYKKMGAIATNTCTPYLAGNIPMMREHIAWGESSAIIFANSVLGSRTNREGGPTALAAAITGRVPAYGYHLDKNRKGTHLFNIEKKLETDKDFAVLGYFAGQIVGSGVPVFEGIKSRPTLENLKALGASLASSGAVALYHIIGYTPEAITLETVINKNTKSIIFGEDQYDCICEKFSGGGTIDFTVIGCPHVSITEFRNIAELIRGKQLKSDLWVCTSRQIKDLAERMGYVSLIEEAGGEVVCDTCPVLCYTLDRGYKTVATNSGKMAHYSPGLWNMRPIILNMEECIKAAIDGKWEV